MVTVYDQRANFAGCTDGRAVLEAVQRGLQRDPASVPTLQRGTPMPPEAQAVMDLLRVLLKATAGRHGVAPKLIATTDDKPPGLHRPAVLSAGACVSGGDPAGDRPAVRVTGRHPAPAHASNGS